MGMTWKDLLEIAKDSTWNELVEGLCSIRSERAEEEDSSACVMITSLTAWLHHFK